MRIDDVYYPEHPFDVLAKHFEKKSNFAIEMYETDPFDVAQWIPENRYAVMFVLKYKDAPILEVSTYRHRDDRMKFAWANQDTFRLDRPPRIWGLLNPSVEDIYEYVEHLVSVFDDREKMNSYPREPREVDGKYPFSEGRKRTTEGFMQPQIEFGDWWEVDTAQGTWFVPKELSDGSPEDLLQYTEAHKISDIYEIGEKSGYGARLSAPGYMDKTDWAVFDTEEEALNFLEDTYGPLDESKNAKSLRETPFDLGVQHAVDQKNLEVDIMAKLRDLREAVVDKLLIGFKMILDGNRRHDYPVVILSYDPIGDHLEGMPKGASFFVLGKATSPEDLLGMLKQINGLTSSALVELLTSGKIRKVNSPYIGEPYVEYRREENQAKLVGNPVESIAFRRFFGIEKGEKQLTASYQRSRTGYTEDQDLSFRQWMKLVDKEVQKMVGVSIHDLSDTDYYDMYENELSPREAAIEALQDDDLYGPNMDALGIEEADEKKKANLAGVYRFLDGEEAEETLDSIRKRMTSEMSDHVGGLLLYLEYFLGTLYDPWEKEGITIEEFMETVLEDEWVESFAEKTEGRDDLRDLYSKQKEVIEKNSDWLARLFDLVRSGRTFQPDLISNVVLKIDTGVRKNWFGEASSPDARAMNEATSLKDLPEEVVASLIGELVHTGVPVRFLSDGQAVDIVTGQKASKGSNVMHHPVYWNFTKETAEKVGNLLGLKPVFSESVALAEESGAILSMIDGEVKQGYGTINYPAWANVYRVDMQYGGPEEGGWWWESYELLDSKRVGNEEHAAEVLASLWEEYGDENDPRQLSSVLSEGKIYIYVESEVGESETRSRPHYEDKNVPRGTILQEMGSSAEDSISANVWAKELYGGKAVALSLLGKGDKFRFPTSPEEKVFTKGASGWYTDAEGRKFRTGAHTAVIPVKDSASVAEAKEPMSNEMRVILIRMILSYLEGEIKKKNKEIVKFGHPSSQIPFDSDDVFFSLAYLSDDELADVADSITNGMFGKGKRGAMVSAESGS